MSVLSPDDLRFAVLSGDAKTIAKAPGIGKKTAEKIILEFRTSFIWRMYWNMQFLGQKHLRRRYPVNRSEIQSEAVQALVALGYGSTESLKAVKQVDISEDTDVEDVLKQALKHMM